MPLFLTSPPSAGTFPPTTSPPPALGSFRAPQSEWHGDPFPFIHLPWKSICTVVYSLKSNSNESDNNGLKVLAPRNGGHSSPLHLSTVSLSVVSVTCSQPRLKRRWAPDGEDGSLTRCPDAYVIPRSPSHHVGILSFHLSTGRVSDLHWDSLRRRERMGSRSPNFY